MHQSMKLYITQSILCSNRFCTQHWCLDKKHQPLCVCVWCGVWKFNNAMAPNANSISNVCSSAKYRITFYYSKNNEW